MMITPQILSIPPYLSSPWSQISFLYANPDGDRFQLTVILTNHVHVIIPDLELVSINAIFEAHSRYGVSATQENASGAISFPFKSAGFELFNFAMQHNPTQANSPDLPPEALEKIYGIAKILGVNDLSSIQKPEPHCNCPYCQISRVFYEGAEEGDLLETDLSFRTWNIEQSGEKLYQVTNPLNPDEHYSVYLGEPLGCTCGLKNCEHIRAVLNS